VSRFGGKHIVNNFAENQNAAASPTLAASPSRQTAGPARGPAKVHGGLQGRLGAGGWGRSWGLGARRGREGRQARRRDGQVPGGRARGATLHRL
jgi:hypothetical protein